MITDIEQQIEQSIAYKKEILNNRALIRQIAVAAEMLSRAFANGKKLLLFGNGGSASDAQHIAAEMVGRFRFHRKPLPALALATNSSIVTAIGNDYDFRSIFERQVEALAGPGDVVAGISASGNSENVLRGLAAARGKRAFAVGLLGNNGGKILSHCDLALVVPGMDTPRIQEAHMMIGHIICDLVEKRLFQNEAGKKAHEYFNYGSRGLYRT